MKRLLATLSLAVAAAAVAAAPASAATSAKMGELTNASYTSVHAAGLVHAEVSFTGWSFQYSTDDATWEPGPGGFFFSPLTAPVQADITGLKPSTKYFVHLVAGGAESPGPDPEFTTLPVSPPAVVSVDNASEIEYTTVRLSGEVSRPENPDTAFDANCNFEYVTDEQFGLTEFEGAPTAGCTPENPVQKAGASKVGVVVGGLTPATKYHLRLKVSNAGGSDAKVAASTFTTQGPIPAPTVATIDNASDVEYTTAKLSGEVSRPAGTDPELDANCNFEYVTDEQFGLTEFEGAPTAECTPENPVKKAGPSKVGAVLGGLTPATKYHLRLKVSNAGGSDAKVAASTFVTLGPVPAPTVISVGGVTGIGYSVAGLSGEVQRPAGTDPTLDAACTFEYIADDQYGDHNELNKLRIVATGGTFTIYTQNSVESGPIAFNASAATVQSAIEGFPEIGAGNVSVTGGPGDATGSHRYLIEFVGALATKNVLDMAPNGGGLTGATIEAPYETVTQGHKEGFEGAGQTPCAPEGTIQKPGTSKVTAAVAGLRAGTEYHWRLVASNGGGTDAKVGANFTTNGPLPLPSATIEAVTQITGTTAHVDATVDPNGTEFAFGGEFNLGCVPACSTSGGIFNYDEIEVKHISVPITGLEPNTDYEVVLTAYQYSTGRSVVDKEPFKTTFAPAAVQAGTATEVTKHSATLPGRINPRNSPATYQFEWGLDRSYGNSAPIPPASLGKVDNFFHPVSQEITGLQEGTVYHYRVSATNTDSGAVSHSEDRIFRTPPETSCANEQVRIETSSLALPECRAYEMVTPIKKSGNDAGFPEATGMGGFSVSSTDGGALVYHTRGTLEGKAKSGLQTYSMSRRGPKGWATEGAIPRGDIPDINAITYYPRGMLFSSDLTRVFWSANFGWTKEVPFCSNLFAPSGAYRGRLSEEEPVEWITKPVLAEPQPPLPCPGVQMPITLGGSPDIERVYFWYQQTLLPGDENRIPGSWGLYEYDGDELRHADTLPDGEQPEGGATPANIRPGPFDREAEAESPDTNRGMISADGRTLYFLSPDPRSGLGPSELYVRHDGKSTLVTRTEDGKPAPSGASGTATGFYGEGSQYVFGSPDGTTAIFQSQDALTANAPKDSSMKAYRYDRVANTITYLPEVGGGTVFASSDDGGRFMFERGNLRLWDHGTLKTVADSGDRVSPARASATGSVFVFQARDVQGFNSGNNLQIYRYDVEGEQLGCVSCPPENVFPAGDSSLGPIASGINPTYVMSPEGNRIFFMTPTALSPKDVNGVGDVYMWTPGGPQLISGGRDPHLSMILASDESGDNVFFSTKEGIAPLDNDGLYDIYDARVDGGFKQAPALIPCSGVDLCHGAPQEPPTESGGGSKQFEIPPTPKFTAVPGDVVRGKLRVKITAPIAATVTASGKGLRMTQHTNPKPAGYKLSIPLKPGALKTLREDHKVDVKVHLHYSPVTGTPSSADLTLTLRE